MLGSNYEKSIPCQAKVCTKILAKVSKEVSKQISAAKLKETKKLDFYFS